MLVRVACCTSKEAWIRGCYGMVFSTFCAADDHEKWCILLQDTPGGAVIHDDDDNRDGSQLCGKGQIKTRHWLVSNLVLSGAFS